MSDVFQCGMNATVNDRNPIPRPINSTLPTENTTLIGREYMAMIEHIDGWFGKIIDSAISKSEKQGRALIACVSSDHGDLLGDYDNYNKKQPWFGSLNVPLVCASFNDDATPEYQIREGKVFSEITVSNMDLGATFLDLAGLDTAQGMTAVSMKPMLVAGDTDEYREYVMSGYGEWRLVVEQSSQMKLVCCKEECPGNRGFQADPITGWVTLLFNLTSDLYDMNDLSKEYPEIVDQMLPNLPDGFCQN